MYISIFFVVSHVYHQKKVFLLCVSPVYHLKFFVYHREVLIHTKWMSVWLLNSLFSGCQTLLTEPWAVSPPVGFLSRLRSNMQCLFNGRRSKNDWCPRKLLPEKTTFHVFFRFGKPPSQVISLPKSWNHLGWVWIPRFFEVQRKNPKLEKGQKMAHCRPQYDSDPPTLHSCFWWGWPQIFKKNVQKGNGAFNSVTPGLSFATRGSNMGGY